MYNFSKKCTIIVVGGMILFSLQGCDQIKKFTDYLSPRSKSQKTAAPAQKPKTPAVQPVQAQQPESQEKPEPAKPMDPDILAQVGEWSITIQDFNERIDAIKGMVEEFDPDDIDQKKYILSELIQQQLLVQEALSQKMDKKEEVLAAIEDARNTILVQALVARIAEGIDVTDEEATAFYNENPQFFETLTEWKVHEIVVDSEEKVKAVLVEINQGASFEDTAKAQSITESAAKGGDLGFLTIPTGDPQLDKNVFPFEKMAQIVAGLDVGAVSGSFKGTQGFYIVKLDGRKGGEIQKLEDIREDLKAYILASKQQQKLFEILAAAQEKNNVNINEQLLEE